MAFETGKGMLVAYKSEGASFNTAPGASGAKVLRLVGGGLELKKAAIRSNEIRSDGQTTIARHGSRMVDGGYQYEFSVGSFDEILEAVMRSTWTAAVAITQATMTSITTTTSTIVAAAGSWITQGVRVGDLVTLTGHATAANNNLRLRVKAVSASTITVIGTPLTADAAPDSTFTLTILKKLKRATTPTRRSFYVEEYNQDIDASQVFGGVRFNSFKLGGSPDGMAAAETSGLGASSTDLASGSSPYYSSPTLGTNPPLVFADSLIALGVPGSLADVLSATSIEIMLANAAKTEPVIGSSFTPDVFDNDARISGTITLLRQDLVSLQRLVGETELELHVTLLEPETDPKDCHSFFIPKIKFMGLGKNIGGDGALIETVQWEGGMKEGVTGYDDTMLTMCSSAA